MNFKVLEQLENLSLVKKCFEIQLPSESCLNTLERLTLIISLYTKDFRFIVQDMISLYLVEYIIDINYFPAINLNEIVISSVCCENINKLVGWFYGISTFVGYLVYFYTNKALFQTVQFSINNYTLIVKNISISSYSV